LQKQFHRAMLDIYEQAKHDVGYNATRFLSMLADRDGVDVAKSLIHAETPSDGYTALWERERLDLTVEAVIQKEQWWPLFTDDDRARAAKRLTQYGYSGYLASK